MIVGGLKAKQACRRIEALSMHWQVFPASPAPPTGLTGSQHVHRDRFTSRVHLSNYAEHGKSQREEICPSPSWGFDWWSRPRTARGPLKTADFTKQERGRIALLRSCKLSRACMYNAVVMVSTRETLNRRDSTPSGHVSPMCSPRSCCCENFNEIRFANAPSPKALRSCACSANDPSSDKSSQIFYTTYIERGRGEDSHSRSTDRRPAKYRPELRPGRSRFRGDVNVDMHVAAKHLSTSQQLQDGCRKCCASRSRACLNVPSLSSWE